MTERTARVVRKATWTGITAATAGSWAACRYFYGVTEDDAGRVLHFYWHHTSGWWFSVCFEMGLVLLLVLSAGLVTWLVRRLPERWRGAGGAVGVVGWFLGAAYIVVWGFLIAMWTGLEGTQTVVQGPDGLRVLVTQDGFDGDTVDVWRQVTRYTYAREPGQSSIDPRSGPCAIERQGTTTMTLICGDTSQVLHY